MIISVENTVKSINKLFNFVIHIQFNFVISKLELKLEPESAKTSVINLFTVF